MSKNGKINDEKNTRKVFGKYLILDHLIDGGMAKVYRARFLDEKVSKIVVIKMIKSHYANDDNFKKMFDDEIKTAFGLIHPNIIQTYDYGMEEGQLYVAIEYCDGKSLKEYYDKLKKLGQFAPIEVSVCIIGQVCQGLHYVHKFTDKLSGKVSNIIHRDISPHNIMLSYDGTVKVIDFGIAKENDKTEATQVGTIKGKLSYLGPEYLEGNDLDHRYDQFAVGITLWEMLCNRKLFTGENDLSILKKIQLCKIPPPSSINPKVPKELDEIVLKALSKNRNKRFENMDKLNRSLIKFINTTYPNFNNTDLAYFAQKIFKNEIKEDREKLFQFGKIDIRSYIKDQFKKDKGQSYRNDNEIKRRIKTSATFVFKNDDDVLNELLDDKSEPLDKTDNITSPSLTINKERKNLELIKEVSNIKKGHSADNIKTEKSNKINPFKKKLLLV